MKLNDITGQRFGRLVVTDRDTSVKKTKWNCICDCGNKTGVYAYNLMDGHTQSCGCFQLEQTSKSNRTHGLSDSSEYVTWCRMRQRCEDPAYPDWKNYGGRGITVCGAWQAFDSFISDMGFRPTDKHTIDRIDNDGNYTPDNCRWATRKTQNRNTRANRNISFNGETRCINEWAELLGFNRNLIRNRLNRGWSVEKTLTTPARKGNYGKH